MPILIMKIQAISIAAPANVSESAGTQSITVTLSAAQTYSVTVNYQSLNVSATSGVDYTNTSGTLTFARQKLLS
ncbi:MAG: hypothetical protein IPI46_00015 [Bacteroidetes bacterium]|nr:hypothetical protein [Bacteroidota bacterium]